MAHPQQHRSQSHGSTARRPLLVACDGDGSSGGLVRLPLQDEPTLPEVGVAGLACVVHHPALAVAYTATGPGAGALQTWSTDGPLRLLASRSTLGTEPCHLAVHPSGRAIVAVNYGSGSLLAVALDDSGLPAGPDSLVVLEGGGPDAERQEAAHPHQAVFVGEGRLLLVPDLGSDLLRVFTLDLATASLTEIASSALPPGTGPRHVVRTRTGAVAVTGELSETLCVGTLDEGTGAVTDWRTTPSTRRHGARRNYPGDLAAVPGTDTVYVANRGGDTLARFDVAGPEPRFLDEQDAGVVWPQHLAVVGPALLVAGRESSLVVRLPLTPEGEPDGAPEPVAGLPRPVWLAP